jgi:diguanylate cyclase (GGDEF)-like protein
VRTDSILIGAILAGLGWLALYAGLTAAGRYSSGLSTFVANIVYLLPIIAAAALSVFAAGRSRGRIRLAWRLLAASNVSWLAGEVAWTLYTYLSTADPPVPSVADIGFVLQYLTALPAVLIGLSVGVLAWTRGLLDALLVSAAAAAIGWQLIIGPLVTEPLTAAALTTFLYPVLDLSIASVVVAVALAGRRPMPRSMIIAGLAFAVAAVTDLGYARATVLSNYSDSSWLNLGWQVEAVLLCLAAIVAVRQVDGDAQPREVDRDLAILPALIAVLAVAAVAIFDKVRLGNLSDLTFAMSMLLFLGLLVRQFIAMRDRTRLTNQLRTAATTDVLTGLNNRRFFEEALGAESMLALHRQTPLSLIMVDLDNFKDVNDSYGHSAGDFVLAQAANRIRQSVPVGDLVSRYGGEEFTCLLRSADHLVAVEVAERVRRTISQTPLAIPDRADTVHLTASLGVATADRRHEAATIDTDDLMKAADQALYQAKAGGRDQVVSSDRLTSLKRDVDTEIPMALVWLSDQIDGMLGTYEHTAAISRWCQTIGAHLGLDELGQRRAAMAGRLHDIGKLCIGRGLLTKPTALNAAEWEQMRRHPEEGARLVTELTGRPDLAPLVAAHHERYDGRGYPHGLAGQAIPIEARIITVCDAWAAMRVDRPYARARTELEAREELITGRGHQFDPVVVDAFLILLDDDQLEGPARHAGPSHPRCPA